MSARTTTGVKALDCAFSLLAREGLLHISGPDSLTFLQGQTTCDTRDVSPSRAVPGVYCTPKGRTVADFLLVAMAEEHFVLRMRQDIVPNAATVLGKYIVFSKAELDPANDTWQVAACWGSDAASVLAGIFDSVPQGRYGCVTGDNYRLVQMDDAGILFECYLRSDCDLATQLASACHAGEAGDWEAAQIAAGIARIESATVEEFIPQMLNYDLTGFISFTKGCYTGQEVVARLHYRGKPKRRSYAGTIEAGAAPAPGTPLFTSGEGQSVGNIVNACTDGDGIIRVLACATADGAAAGLHLADNEGPEITLAELPYPLVDPDAD
jgi:folate-binding protein YgfZ